MSSTTAGGTAVEYYSAVPTFIPPTSFSDTGVPTFDPSKTPSPQLIMQDLSSPPSSNHAHPTTPSPPPEASNPYANDPWAPQNNQSIKLDALAPPKSPNLSAQRKMHSRFAVPAPSSGSAGYKRRAATEFVPAAASATSPRFEQEEYGSSPPVPALSVTPTETSAASKNAKSGITKDSLSKSFARLSLSLSGRSKSGKKNSPPAPADETVPQPSYNASTITSSMSPQQRPMSMVGSPATSTRPRSFIIPQTLEEWEAFNKAMMVRPPASHQRPPSTHLRPPSSSSKAGMLPGPRLAASLAASPLNSPGASPRRSVVDLPPPPIVLGEWERKRLAETQGIPFPSAPSQPPPQQQQPQQQQSQRPGLAIHQPSEVSPPSSSPSSRPTTPGGNESKRSSLFFLNKRKSSGAVSPAAVNTTPTPFPLPPRTSPQAEQSPSPSRVPSPKPVALAAAVASTSPSPAPPAAESSSDSPPVTQPLSDAEAAVLRARTVSLPEASKPARPLLAPIQTDVSSPSLKWARPKSWMGVMGGGNRARSNSVSEGVDAGANDDEAEIVRARVVSIERRVNPNSNGARLKALRRSSRGSSIDLTTSGSAAPAAASAEKDADDKRSLMSDGGRLRNLLRKRRPSSASDAETGSIDTSLKAKLKKKQPQGGAMGLPPGAAQPMLGKGANYAVSPGAVSPNPAAEPELKDGAANASEKRRSRRFSFGMKNLPGAIQSIASPVPAAASPAPPAVNTEGENEVAAAIVPAAAPAAPGPVVTPVATTAETKRSRRFSSFGLKNSTADVQPAASPALANDAEGEGQQASNNAEKRRSRRFSFGLKNATGDSPSPAEGEGQQASKDGEKRRSRKFSFGMKNPFSKTNDSSVASPVPAVNPHALLPPGAAKPAIPSRAGSQGTVDAVQTPIASSPSNSSSANTTPAAVADSSASSIKPPSPPPLSYLSRSANNSSQSLATKMNPFKRKPPPSISDESFVMVPTLNKGKGKLKLEVSDAEKERLERMSAPPSLPDSRPQTPSDNTIPVRLFGSGKRESFFADDDGREEKIDESSNRVSRFLSQYAANNELGLAIPSPSLKGMPLAPSSSGDSTANSIAATDSTDHSDVTARGKTPDRFEY